ncbi:MAG: T9SS type A sorting domain-containing protein [Vicingaceae bacterium]
MLDTGIAFLFALALPFQIFSQSYTPILSDSSSWYFTNEFFGYRTDHYWASIDTVIDSKNYKVLDGFHFNRNAFVREDTTAQRFYYRQTKNFRANQDVLIFDFKLQVGDSMILYNPNVGGFSDSAGMFTLDSISTIQVLAGNRKIYYLHGPNAMRAEWIGGIGSTYMLNSGGAAGDISNGGELTCFFQSNQHIYQSAVGLDFGACDIQTVGIKQNENVEFKIAPNPVQRFISLHPAPPGPVRWTIRDLSGKVVKQKTASENALWVADLSKGVYLVEYEINKTNYRQLLVVQ